MIDLFDYVFFMNRCFEKSALQKFQNTQKESAASEEVNLTLLFRLAFMVSTTSVYSLSRYLSGVIILPLVFLGTI